MVVKKDVVISVRLDKESRAILEQMGLLNHIGQACEVDGLTCNSLMIFCLKSAVEKGSVRGMPSSDLVDNLLKKKRVAELNKIREDALNELLFIQSKKK